MMHDLLAWSVVFLCLWGIISPRVPTGIVPTIGLGLISAAAMWSVDDWAPPDRVVELMMAGVAMGGAGLMVRFYRRRKGMMRRATDWVDTRWPRELDQHAQQQVTGGTKEPTP